MSELKIKFNEKYSHCTKLSKVHYELFLIFYILNNDIRSPEIVQFIYERYDISINRGWVNQKLAQCGCTRPRGRPTKEYQEKKLEYRIKLTKTADKIEQIGIPFIIDLMDSIGITDIFLEVLLELTEKYKSKLPQNRDALRRFIHTLDQIVLDPRINNFEEAIRSQMPHKEMNIERSRQLIKECEKLGMIEYKLSNGFINFWIKKLRLEDKVVSHFVDGHGAPYYTGKSFITGRMSVTQKIMPGTHYVVHTTEGGFILNICSQEADTHLNYGLHDECEVLYKKLTCLVDLVIVDRECNGKEISKFIKENYGISLLTGLRSNQYKNLSDFDYEWIEEGKLAYGKWHNLKKQKEDNRTFLLLLQQDKLIVFATTSEDPEVYAKLSEKQSMRWSDNENVIKLLVNEFDFNVNVGNGTYEIDNPKRGKVVLDYFDKISRCNNHLKRIKKKLKTTHSDASKRKFENSYEKWDNRKTKYKEERASKLKKMPLTVKTRQFEPQIFMSLLKAGMLNSILYLLSIVFPNVKALSVGMEKVNSLLLNRSGKIEKSDHSVLYSFEPPVRQKDREFLKQFLSGISKLNLTDRKGRLIIANLLPGET